MKKNEENENPSLKPTDQQTSKSIFDFNVIIVCKPRVSVKSKYNSVESKYKYEVFIESMNKY